MSVDTQLVEAVCVAVLSLQDPAQRKVFLDRTCAGDERLREAVDQGRLEVVLLDWPQPQIPYHLLWPATPRLPVRTRTLIDFLVARLGVEQF